MTLKRVAIGDARPRDKNNRRVSLDISTFALANISATLVPHLGLQMLNGRDNVNWRKRWGVRRWIYGEPKFLYGKTGLR